MPQPNGSLVVNMKSIKNLFGQIDRIFNKIFSLNSNCDQANIFSIYELFKDKGQSIAKQFILYTFENYIEKGIRFCLYSGDNSSNIIKDKELFLNYYEFLQKSTKKLLTDIIALKTPYQQLLSESCLSHFQQLFNSTQYFQIEEQFF
eukprot:TRINITY_DN24400_c0_g1_i1.p2 TRINITY_DN24400_c0_g1~~TRINITY_DN24400_c0_g1_i1.p2  ORF type:complete len:147 (-),score=24.62 TRINITY_DN24400_c0_g1_i1:85-525(-)